MLLIARIVTAVVILFTTYSLAQETTNQLTLGSDGLWKEDWMENTSGDLRGDLRQASLQGKILVIFWEEPGCKFCSILHLETLRSEELSKFFYGPFYPIRFKVSGDSLIVDLDGTIDTERNVSIKHQVIGTPTIEFILGNGDGVLRLPGLADHEILFAAFEYVSLGMYANFSFPDWLETKGLL